MGYIYIHVQCTYIHIDERETLIQSCRIKFTIGFQKTTTDMHLHGHKLIITNQISKMLHLPYHITKHKLSTEPDTVANLFFMLSTEFS